MPANDFPIVTKGAPVLPDLWYNPVAEAVTALRVTSNTFTPRTAEKAATTSRASTTSRIADPELSVSLPASSKWDFDGVLFVTSDANAAGDLAWEMTFPTGATVSVGQWSLGNSLASGSQADLEAFAVAVDAASPTGAFAVGASTTVTGVYLRGRIVMSTTAGSLVVAWAQFASNATPTNVLAGSFMTCRQVV